MLASTTSDSGVGGNCWDIPTDPCTPTHPRIGPADARLYRPDRQTTPTMTPIMTVDNGCRPYLTEGMPAEQTHTVPDRSSGRTHITDSLSGVAVDVRLSQGTRSADGVSESPPDDPAVEYRHIVGQSIQMPYNRYGLFSCQGHAVRPPWGVVLPRTWVSDLITHADLTVSGNLTTLQLSAPLMTEPYRILL